MNADDGGRGVDRVLSTRLESVRQILRELRNLSDDVRNARRGLDEVSEHIAEMGSTVARSARKVGTLQSEVESSASDMAVYTRTGDKDYLPQTEDLQRMAETLHDLRDELNGVKNRLSVDTVLALNTMRRWAPLAQQGADMPMTVKRLAGELTATLQETEEKDDPWAFYHDVVKSQCDDLFAQYVDLVGGIAMRDQGLDGQVSPLADRLVEELIVSFSGPSTTLAVPSRHARGPLIHTQHVRIPLPPGWTLWTLPLIARGVGELFRQTLDVEEPVRSLVPHVFGVYVCGPAYVLASLLIELDPGDPLDRLRARAMLEALRSVDESDDRRSFDLLADEIEVEWNRALAATAPQPDEKDATDGGAAEPTAEAPDGDNASALSVSASVERALRLVEQSCSDGAFLPEDRWTTIQDIATSFGDAAAIDEMLDMRDVLNAMWLARWRRPELLEQIEASATDAAHIVVTPRGKASMVPHGPARHGRRS
jgi:hypothetical protein